MGITEEEILEDLARELEQPRIQPGDIPERRLAEKMGCGRDAVHNRMKDKLASGDWQRLKVINEDGLRVIVYRKVTRESP